jgi:hypothetical protein
MRDGQFHNRLYISNTRAVICETIIARAEFADYLVIAYGVADDFIAESGMSPRRVAKIAAYGRGICLKVRSAFYAEF